MTPEEEAAWREQEFLARATPEEAAAYKRGQLTASYTVKRVARDNTTLRLVLSKIARGDFHNPSAAARQVLDSLGDKP